MLLDSTLLHAMYSWQCNCAYATQTACAVLMFAEGRPHAIDKYRDPSLIVVGFYCR